MELEAPPVSKSAQMLAQPLELIVPKIGAGQVYLTHYEGE